MTARATRILCATDLLPGSDAAIERAGILAERLSADLSLLHVVEPHRSDRALEQALEGAITELEARARPPAWQWGASPQAIVTAGQPGRCIVDALAEGGFSLAVLGPHRRRMPADALSRTVAERVLVSGASPLLIAKRKPVGEYRRVLIALDLSRLSPPTLRAVESLMLTRKTEAVIVHAYEPHYEGMLTLAGVSEESTRRYERRWAQEMEISVRDFLKRDSRDFTRYSIVAEQSRPVPAILRAAERVHPDLVVMGTRGHGRLKRALLGSVASRVLHAATCDVLLVQSLEKRPVRHERTREVRVVSG